MPENSRFLLGYGERLTRRVAPPGGGGGAEPAYSFDEARDRLAPMLEDTTAILSNLPLAARPAGEVVGVVTLHPQWMAKSYHPQQLLNEYGLRQVGSRPVAVQPEKWSRQDDPELMASSELYIAGQLQSFQTWGSDLENAPASLSQQIRRLESVRAPRAQDRLRSIDGESSETDLFEVVLHASASPSEQYILSAFTEYAASLQVRPHLDRRLHVGGLCFLPVEAQEVDLPRLADFSFLRVARPMPRLRRLPEIERSVSAPSLRPAPLPAEGAVASDLRVAVFDGGLDPASELRPWSRSFDCPGLEPPVPSQRLHGHDVTSALLFGPLVAGQPAPRPFATVDHYRVLDNASGSDPFELYEALRRIDEVLRSRRYDFFNLSVGPAVPVEDDEVHPWTALLDDYLADGRALGAIAVGNTGEELDEPNESRVQVPSDCVNAMSVGAADSTRDGWKRAPYSSVGPGRSPGLVKPDLVHFGGSEHERFCVYDPKGVPQLAETCGTSFASPAALRLAVGVRAHFGGRISPLALKALLVHCADSAGQDRQDVGWGRVPRTIDPIVLCDDGVVRVVYQGELNPAQYLRAQLPLPEDPLAGMVKIGATFCYATATDPQDPGSYTRSGLEVTFRPHLEKFAHDEAVTPISQSFFKKSPFDREQVLRSDAQKWETTMNAERTFRATSLSRPVFDIHYNARESGGPTKDAEVIRYALVISVEAKRVPDLYDRVVRAYAGRLEALTPLVEIPVQV
jgi:hypothetical protein